MNLRIDIERRSQSAIEALLKAHDYYEDTRSAWTIVCEKIRLNNEQFRWTNVTTGTVTGESDLVTKAQLYLAKELPESTFLQFVSIFEGFVADLLRIWLRRYPKSLSSKKQVNFGTILNAQNLDDVIQEIVDKEVDEVFYGPPVAWFSYFKEKLNWMYPDGADVDKIAEIKTTRDILVHNNGIINAVYLSKAGQGARGAEGQRVEVDEVYHRETWKLLHGVIEKLRDIALNKLPKESQNPA